MFREIVSSVGVVGNGVVGAATAAAFAPYVGEVRVYDKNPKKSKGALRDAVACDIVFVCLPTPSSILLQEKGGVATLDTSAVDDFLKTMKGSGKHIIIKSTTPVGYCRGAASRYVLENLVHWPEFLSARVAKAEAARPRMNLVGRTRAGQDVSQIVRFVEERFPFVPCQVASSDETEFAKLATNALAALKVTAFNELHLVAREKKLDWDAVLRAILGDGRMTEYHTEVPGHDGFGWGGHCFGKDLAAVAGMLTEAQGGMLNGVLNAVAASNELHRLRSH